MEYGLDDGQKICRASVYLRQAALKAVWSSPPAADVTAEGYNPRAHAHPENFLRRRTGSGWGPLTARGRFLRRSSGEVLGSPPLLDFHGCALNWTFGFDSGRMARRRRRSVRVTRRSARLCRRSVRSESASFSVCALAAGGATLVRVNGASLRVKISLTEKPIRVPENAMVKQDRLLHTVGAVICTKPRDS
ncbi:hypothetical protein AOLI_G00089520 [Acnodon oligacanthus]